MKLKWMFVLAMGTFLFSCNNINIDTTEEAEVVEETMVDEATGIDSTIGDNSRVSLDWSGTYKGLLPCADCEGIEAVITLNEDETFHYEFVYLVPGDIPLTFEQTGKFKWDSAGSKITFLLENSNDKLLFRVGENHLLMLDSFGEITEGTLADAYILNKQ